MDFDPRDYDSRDRDGRDIGDPRDAFMRDLDLPRGQVDGEANHCINMSGAPTTTSRMSMQAQMTDLGEQGWEAVGMSRVELPVTGYGAGGKPAMKMKGGIFILLKRQKD